MFAAAEDARGKTVQLAFLELLLYVLDWAPASTTAPFKNGVPGWDRGREGGVWAESDPCVPLLQAGETESP